MGSDSIINANNVSLSLAGKVILKDINFKITKCELVTIIGQNGAGKSSILKIISGFLQPCAGSMNVMDHSFSKTPSSKQHLRRLRCQIGYVFQGLFLVPRLNVIDNVLVGRLAHNSSFFTWARIFNQKDRLIAEEALSTVGMLDRAYDRVDKLSGGERQKVAIARALAQEPKLILADEPTAALDPSASLEIANLLAKIAREKKLSMLSVVHNVNLIPILSDRVLGLKSSNLVFDLSASEFSSYPLEGFYL
ncbi:MAG: ATP-binding cassette domain-containing protein [Oligoflexales bacterium]|nr:ATP-binding cassette domain-containing protein [Oligoflexales bacterium]